ncbi:site-specific DNA-methyltransferase [Qipengyuania sp. YIM B01966]|uniref:site-specific DNA-methyltransferase n=1 Tax=Qipengyuania sp. YIM B01966 TaxID=2778646 RepID=UPI0018F548C9|nr:site-specific DNA-methyltransferase [Qipengyuania sp. YIM B01966]
MILGDSLQVMASLAEREALRGKVQCIYFDPPYGIKFGSNWQVSTMSRDVKDGKQADIAREPEQVKAFRDTWKDGIHSYLTYLRDRLVVMRDLLTDSGSIFVQISDENVHRVRAVMDEVFGEENFVAEIALSKATGLTSQMIASTFDYIIWYARKKTVAKYRRLYLPKDFETETDGEFRWIDHDRVTVKRAEPSDLSGEGEKIDALFRTNSAVSPGVRTNTTGKFRYLGLEFNSGSARNWKTTIPGMVRLCKANRILPQPKSVRIYKQFWKDFDQLPLGAFWSDVRSEQNRIYVVQTVEKAIQRCILMATDPGDLVLDPTCGSGTTATVAEQWGRRWITIDTSRVALALARTRMMANRYPWYLLADSEEGRSKESDLTLRPPSDLPINRDLRQGFVYDRVPHIKLSDIAKNTRIDEIWDRWQGELEAIREALNHKRGRFYANEREGYNRDETQAVPASANPDLLPFEEWSMPSEAGSPWPADALKPFAAAQKDNTKRATREKHLAKLNEILGRAYTLETLPDAPVDPWDDEEAIALHAQWWEARIARQKEIDEVIAKTAETEYLYDKPYEDPGRVRVAGPFTVESLSPHRVLPASEDDSLAEDLDAAEGKRVREDDGANNDFAAIVIEYLKSEGVKQQEKGDRIRFESVIPWPGQWIGAEGRFMEGSEGNQTERRAAIFIGPEFGTTGRSDLVAAAREAVDNRFDLVIACAFNFDAHSSELDGLGSLKILKARINPDMHMSDELKNTGSGNMFVVFGEPDVEILDDGGEEIRVKVNGVDVFDPNTGDIRSNDTKGIAAWFIDTDYNEESFFVRHAYFLGANDPYSSLKTALKAEIDEEAWSTLYSDTSRPFERPDGGRIAVKVINHFGDEVMKVFGV